MNSAGQLRPTDPLFSSYFLPPCEEMCRVSDVPRSDTAGYSVTSSVDFFYLNPMEDFPVCPNPFDFVIITRPIFVDKSSEYLDWKASQGFNTKLVTVEDIIQRYPGINVTDKIKAYIHAEHAASGAKYFMFVGDAYYLSQDYYSTEENLEHARNYMNDLSEPWMIPSACMLTYTEHHWRELHWKIPEVGNCVDFFYAESHDWDPDRDGMYEDSFFDSHDSSVPVFNFPVYIARIPVRVSSELDNIFYKLQNFKKATSFYEVYGDDDYNSDMYDFSDPDTVLEHNPCFSGFAIPKFMRYTNIPYEIERFPTNISSTKAVSAKLFHERTVSMEGFHGNFDCIYPPDPAKPICDYNGTQVSPLLITQSCMVDAFYATDRDGFYEKLLKSRGGPAMLVSPPQATTFVAFLAGGSTFGEAYYKTMSLVYINTYGGTRAILGDPSLTVFENPGFDPSFDQRSAGVFRYGCR